MFCGDSGHVVYISTLNEFIRPILNFIRGAHRWSFDTVQKLLGVGS